MKKLLTVCLLAILYVTSAFAQHRVTVTVKDDVGPVPGANVLIKGTTTGEMTDIDGVAVFETVKDTDVLEVSFIGYRTVEVTVGQKAKINVTLEMDSELLQETVLVGYGTQKKGSLTSAVASVKSEDIVATKQSNLISSLQGKVPGLQIKQQSGRPGAFNTDLNLRGFGAPLVIIDGVARQETIRDEATMMGYWTSSSGTAALAQLNPEDIESITVLKDASASIYGLGAQNGVILVTTKKGSIGKPSVNYSNNFSFGTPTAFPKRMDIVTTMNLINEMQANVGGAPKYSEDLIQHYANGDEGYVDTDWFDAIMNDYSFNMTHNLAVRGGTQQTQYYLSGSYTEDNSLWKSDSMNYKRLNFTGNVNTKITNELSASFQATIMNSTNEGVPGNTNQMIFYYAAYADRTIEPTVQGNPSHYSDLPTSEHRNPAALLNRDVAGYSDNHAFTSRNNLEFKYEPKWLKGLSISAMGAYDYQTYRTDELMLSFPLYDYRTDEQTSSNPDTPSYSESWNNNQKIYGKIQANFIRRFGDHNVNATIAAEATKTLSNNIYGKREYDDFFTHDVIDQGVQSTQTNSGSRSDAATAGYIARASYDYKGKYLVDITGRYDGTYYYAPGYRWGFFPSYSLGYRISEEPWFKAAMPWFNNLKFRWSDGYTGETISMVGWSSIAPYAWQLGYSPAGSYVFNDGTSLTGYNSRTVAQTLLSWTDVRFMDFGIDWDMWRGKFGGSIDWFWRETSGIAGQTSESVPEFYGLSLPYQNLNKSENVGIDLQITHQNNVGEFWYRIAATATMSRSRTTYQASDESAIYYSASHYYSSNYTGRWSNARGSSTYHWLDGSQFTGINDAADENVLYNTSKGNSSLIPGTYRLEDRDGDGVITSNDMYFDWSESNPPLQFGLIFSGRYKGLDFNINFNGGTLTNKYISLSGGYGYGYFPTFYETHMDHYSLAEGYTDPKDPNSVWTSGYYPALIPASQAGDTSANYPYHANQPYNYVNGTYLRLKSVEIGYTLPEKWTKAVGINSLRLYVNGTNLLTFSNKLLKPYDPESSAAVHQSGITVYPLMRTFSFGLNLNF